MKNVIIILLFNVYIINYNLVMAQESFKGRIGENSYVELMIFKNTDGSVSYNQKEITGNSSIFTGLYNIPALEFDNEQKSLFIPSDGNKYWFIPFEQDVSHIQLREEATYCIDCNCDHISGFCTVSWSMGKIGCGYENCSCCNFTMYKCDGGISLRGGGVIIEATRVNKLD